LILFQTNRNPDFSLLFPIFGAARISLLCERINASKRLVGIRWQTLIMFNGRPEIQLDKKRVQEREFDFQSMEQHLQLYTLLYIYNNHWITHNTIKWEMKNGDEIDERRG
jgi:hypothetical protein